MTYVRRGTRALGRDPFAPPGAPRDLAAASARIIHACNRHSRAAWGQLVISLDVEAKLPHLEMPAHVLVGSAGRLTPPVHARRMAGLLPRWARPSACYPLARWGGWPVVRRWPRNASDGGSCDRKNG